MFKHNEHGQLASLEFSPDHYANFSDLRDAYTATKFLSKFKGLTLDADLDKVALEKFYEFEDLCKQTNIRFSRLARDPKFKGNVVWLHNAVVRKIDSILGEFSIEDFFSLPDWGPGASTLIKRRDASPARKFQSETGITRDLFNLIGPDILSQAYPLWGRHLLEQGFPTFQSGNKVITVAKDASTNRVIAVEPGLNLFFQQSVGKMIGRRLRRCGIDLRFQGKNQRLAQFGSYTDSVASVDFSSASDSIAYSVVEELIPRRWFAVMDACRSRFGNQSGQVIEWEKFSSMGNGFTFQLESLIFYAAAFCCTDFLNQDTSLVSAYGDDVLLPSVCFDLFKDLVEFYGFRINKKKSHVNSPFRESCGAHWYCGVDVKPIYLKDRVSSVLAVYRLANAIRRLAHRRNSYGCDARLQHAFDLLTRSVPSGLRLRIPDGYGDGGFISNFDEATPSRAHFGQEGHHFKHVMETSRTRQDETEGLLLASLWKLPEVPLIEEGEKELRQRLHVTGTVTGKSRVRLEALAEVKGLVGEEGSRGNSIPLVGVVRLNLCKSLAQQWSDLGPWL